MRRFVKSIFVRRHLQVTVIQDGKARQFEIWVWRAADHSLTMRHHYPYAPGASSFVKTIAVTEAVRIAAEAKARRAE